MAMDRAVREQWKRLIPVVIVVSHLKGPNKEEGKSVKIEIGVVGVNDRKDIWKNRMERLMNVENKWGSKLLLVWS